jgi:drug/metabolite transporter (DMT)-like permease
MNDPPALALLLPLTSAILYVVGALLLRRANQLGVGFWRTTFVANLICAAMYMPLLFFGGNFHWTLLWQPAVAAALFMGGSVLNFLSLDRGDVSIATPVLGLKIILVAVFVALLIGEPLTVRLWIASGMSTLAIALLNWTRTGHHHHVAATILAAGSSALTFALFDVLVQRWSPAWGVGRFPPVMLGFVVLFTCCLVPLFPKPLSEVSGQAWPWLLGGSLVLGLQSLLFVGSLAHFGQATAANVIYSSRGLWSIVLVWLIGHWFHNAERDLGASILAWRLAGAVLILAAIALVML